ncbi:hypothetical protein [Lysinibacillus fusiformis]|uniref:hypothetical protein n=1 Tax=Lysinibacillus fusiformis TaxID=28031 RepID=UPI0023A9DCCA|nr:hypothetical protein [Lysinibacillus fusiformis]WEA37309.1 hypothetical protein PWJ66_11445 [Lysinibacillus fusiformis]
MSKKSYLFHLILGLMTGFFFLPTLLEWGGIPFTLADVIELIFGEPNQTSRTVVLILLVILLFFIIRSFYKQYKKLM